VAVNSLGLVDLVEIAAAGLAPRAQYQVYVAQSNHPPFGKLQPLVILKTNPHGADIVQAIGRLKVLAANGSISSTAAPRRFLIVTAMKDSWQVVLQQTVSSSDGDSKQ
jgi:hypothetical protein